MTHEVTLPSGAIAVFPDTMSDDDVRAALQTHPALAGATEGEPAAPPNLPGYLDLPGAPPTTLVAPPENPLARVGQVGGPALVKGMAETAGLPGDLAALALPAPIAEKLPTSAEALAFGPVKSLITAASAQPRNLPERMIAGAGESIGAGLPLALAGPAAGLVTGGRVGDLAKALATQLGAGTGAPYLPAARATIGQFGTDLAKTLLQTGIENAAAGAGGAAGQDVLPGAGEPLGALAGLGLGIGGRGIAGRLAGVAAGAENPMVSAMDRLGMTPRLAGDVTGSDLLKGLQSTALRAPGGGLAARGLQDTLDDFGRARNSVADALTPGLTAAPVTLEDAGARLQQRMRDWHQQFQQDQKTAWGQVDQKIPGDAPVFMAGVNNVLQDTAQQMPNAPELAQVMTDPVFKNLQQALSSDVGMRNALDWSDVKNWRTQVGNRLDQSLMAADPSAAGWRRLYGALSDAMNNTATAQGAAGEFANAAGITSRGHQFDETVGSGLIDHADTARNQIPEAQAANFALAGSNIGGNQGGARLAAIRQTLGDDAADELAGFKIHSMASAKPFGQNAAGDAASPGSFLTNWNTLSPGARDALYGDEGAREAKRINDLLTVSQGMKDTAARYGNPSGTTGAGMHGLALAGAIGLPASVIEGYSHYGLPGAVAGGAGALTPLMLGPVAANLTARPTLTRLLAMPSEAASAGQRWLTRLGAGVPLGERALAPLIAQGDVAR